MLWASIRARLTLHLESPGPHRVIWLKISLSELMTNIVQRGTSPETYAQPSPSLKPHDKKTLCSTMWVGCQSRRFLCLFWRETRQRILGPEISPYPEVGRGREWELAGQRSGGQLALDSREATKQSWRGTTDRGSQHRTPETSGDKIGSSKEDRLKMSAFEVLVEFSLVTHASDSSHLHIVLQYLFSALG